jgi:hypothetical protein
MTAEEQAVELWERVLATGGAPAEINDRWLAVGLDPLAVRAVARKVSQDELLRPPIAFCIGLLVGMEWPR